MHAMGTWACWKLAGVGTGLELRSLSFRPSLLPVVLLSPKRGECFEALLTGPFEAFEIVP